ncbi:MAG: hypothetical protein HYR60_17225, partial [Acidobacteria bacterium]|nr:hypothetical protein [Acidobacteriota bacterium]
TTPTQAGSFPPVDGHTQVLCSNANFLEQPCGGAALLQYIEHTTNGTRPGTTTGATFDFDWTPPATNVGNIMLYAAGNASNNNAQNTGDNIYTTNVMLTPGAGGIPAMTLVNPNTGQQGQTNLNVALTGQFTNFLNGTSVASFSGTGITVNSTTVSDATHATANISIAASATVGARNVTVTTGSQVVTLNSSFTVTAGGTKPVISQGGVANGAGFQANIAAATWISVFGSNLSTSTRTLMASEVVGGNLPTALDGVSLTVNGKPAFPYSISPGLLTAQSPSDSAVGPVNVVVTLNGVPSDPVPVPLQTFSPAFFLWPGGVAVATDPNFNFRVKPGTFPGATTVAAKPDEVIILWGTGFGPSNPDVPAGQLVPGDRAYNIANPVTVTVGNITAEVFGAALAAFNASVVQVAIRVPPNAPDGDLPVVATVGGVSSPATTLLTVKR